MTESPDFTNNNRGINEAAKHLAYELWQYESPNERAESNALVMINQVILSLRAVGLTIANGEP